MKFSGKTLKIMFCFQEQRCLNRSCEKKYRGASESQWKKMCAIFSSQVQVVSVFIYFYSFLKNFQAFSADKKA